METSLNVQQGKLSSAKQNNVLPLCESRNALLQNTASREMTLFDEYSICLKMKAVVCLLGDILFFLLLCLFGLLAFKIKVIALHYTEKHALLFQG